MVKTHRKLDLHSSINQHSSASLGLKRRVEMQTNGQTFVSFSFDADTAPTPDRKYLADIASIVCGVRSIKLLFAQEKVSGGLRNLLVVEISPGAASTFIKSTNEVKNPTFKEVAELNQLPIPELSVIIQEPEQTVALKANIISCAVSGHDACIDFYYISAVAMRKLATTDKVNMDAVVRVDMDSNLFLAVLEQLESSILNFPELKGY